MNQEFKFRVTAFIRTKAQTVSIPVEPIPAQFVENEQGQILSLFKQCKTLAKNKYQDRFEYISCLRVTLIPGNFYKLRAYLNLEREYVDRVIKLPEGDKIYSFDKFFEHLIELGQTIHGEEFDGIFHLKFFYLDDDNIAINFS